MTLVSEIERTELVNQLVAAIGEGPAETLMKCVLPDGRNQLATKDDLRVLSAEMATKDDLRVLSAEMATKDDLRVLSAEMATKEDLRALGAELRAEFRAEFATKDDLKVLRAEMATKEDLKALATELRAEFAKQTRMYLMVLTAFVVPIWAAMAAQFFI